MTCRYCGRDLPGGRRQTKRHARTCGLTRGRDVLLDWDLEEATRTIRQQLTIIDAFVDRRFPYAVVADGAGTFHGERVGEPCAVCAGPHRGVTDRRTYFPTS